MVTVNNLLKDASQKITSVADSPVSEARLLLSYVSKMSISDIIIYGDKILDETCVTDFMECIKKRSQNMPIAYITGTKEFYSLDFEVTPSVLIPRPDTEVLVDFILSQKINTMLDLCSGSGCISIAAAVNNKNLNICAVDISMDAKNIAEKNSARHGTENQIKFICADAKNFDYPNKFDMIVSNPPYIKSEDIQSLMSDVKNYEPAIALDGGKDGLDFYKKIINVSAKNINSRGILAFEIGINQYDEIEKMMQLNFENINSIYDLSGIKRVIYGKLRY